MTEFWGSGDNLVPHQQLYPEASIEQGSEQHNLAIVRFSSSDREARQLLARMPNTVSYGPHDFPAIHQYHDEVASIIAHPGAPHDSRVMALAQRSWHSRGQNGCNFARIAAAHAENLVWEYAVAGPEVNKLDQTLAQAVGVSLERAVADQDTQVHSVLLPGVKSPREAVAALGALTDHSKFWLERNEVADELLRLNLRYPVGDSGIQAWVMAFGPFDFMPSTRKAPYFELVTRVKPKPPKIYHRLNQDASIAHLADTTLGLTDEAHAPVFDRTLQRTRDILGKKPDDVTAAKATLAVPVELLQ